MTPMIRKAPMIGIRRFRDGDEAALLDIYRSAVRRVARRDYTVEQIEAWAPVDMDLGQWAARIREINPFVAESNGQAVGYADLQPTGYIHHFFVSGHHPRTGIGALLMHRLLREAAGLGLIELTADVSRTAQPFFERFGFSVVEPRFPVRRGVVIPNAFMRRTCDASEHQAILRTV